MNTNKLYETNITRSANVICLPVISNSNKVLSYLILIHYGHLKITRNNNIL